MSQQELERTIVVDSSSIITISDNCMIKVVRNLAQISGIKFVLPESVYEESVVRPLSIKRYELNAVRIKDAVQDGYISVVRTTQSVARAMDEIGEASDRICTAGGKALKLIQRGETEALALANELGVKTVLVDERTTRMLVEEPQNMHGVLERRHERKIVINPDAAHRFMGMFENFKIVRSVELIALAYESGAFGEELHKSREALEASLWAAKYAGCAVSEDEIRKYMATVAK